mmetsp:Transcript_31764/g.48741  ORF Transcript_31764/g.48741 Transcript_31764/m.48741 type:complete len:82 (+) Transcript_31764:1878-2123(+)
MIAHRLSTVRDCDFILVLKAGEIVEHGSHDELLAIEDGYYARLWSKQSEQLKKMQEETEEEKRAKEEMEIALLQRKQSKQE